MDPSPPPAPASSVAVESSTSPIHEHGEHQPQVEHQQEQQQDEEDGALTPKGIESADAAGLEATPKRTPAHTSSSSGSRPPLRALPTNATSASHPSEDALLNQQQPPTAVSSVPPPSDVYEPRQRLEWQTMLSSVLGSEVLRSETKRITSADAPVLTPTQLMYHRWLEIHAKLRGRAKAPSTSNSNNSNSIIIVEAEEKRLRPVWETMLKDLIREVKEWTPSPHALELLRQSEREVADARDIADAEASSKPASSTSHPTRTFQSQEAKDAVLHEVGQLLERVDLIESQFPSTRKVIEVCPQWGSPEVQTKLASLYSWYNVSKMLRLQISILQRWTGSENLDIERPHHAPGDLFPAVIGSGIPTEGTTFVERIFKEDNLTYSFEKRTLSALNRVIEKAKRNILRHHLAFEKLHLPSFEPELVQIISFPTRLMEAALKLRLDYAGKLHDPGMLIVDSLTDDMRNAIAVACRIKVQYNQTMVPDQGNGWAPPPCISKAYDVVLREALTFFFKLLNFKLMGSVFFKETEILEPEWKFLSTAADVIEGGDFIVAKNITHIVNKLFARIMEYFDTELNAPSTSRGGRSALNGPVTTAIGQPTAGPSVRAPPQVGVLTRGKVRLSLEDTTKWIHAVFDNVRIRSRKLLGFARDIRLRLDNAAEYDLSSLRYGVAGGKAAGEKAGEDGADHDYASGSQDEGDEGGSNSTAPGRTNMDLNTFMQTLINAGFFLVYTESFEDQGTYIVAEPTLHNRPELVYELLTRCIPRRRGDDDDLFGRDSQAAADEGDAAAQEQQANAGTTLAGGAADESQGISLIATAAADAPQRTASTAGGALEDEDSAQMHYLLLLSPRDPFLWTGRVMTYPMHFKGIELKDHRMRLVADGPKGRLQRCKEHLMGIFAAAAGPAEPNGGPTGTRSDGQSASSLSVGAGRSAAAKRTSMGAIPAPALEESAQPHVFPLAVVHEHMAHMAEVQRELKEVNKGIYMLSVTILNSTLVIRRKMRNKLGKNLRLLAQRRRAASQSAGSEGPEVGQQGGAGGAVHGHGHGLGPGRAARAQGQVQGPDHDGSGGAATGAASGVCDELIQNCFTMAAEHGFRCLPFMDSSKLQLALTMSLATVSINWVAFICEDCVPTDRKTFKWAVAALENAMQVTKAENIFRLSEGDFALLRNKVASCMALLISHFDIMGARSSAAKAKEEQERLEREKAERGVRAAAGGGEGADTMGRASADLSTASHGGDDSSLHDPAGSPAGCLQRPESPVQATIARWAAKGREWDVARQDIESQQQLIGRVLDETRLEDRGLSFLAASSKMTIRWQQGRMIGSGTFGTVYSAVNLDSGELMAVKEIRFQDITSNPEVYKQIKDEMSVMEMLSHPNIVNYFGIEVHRDKVYIFEEYCANGSLAALLSAGRIEDEAIIQVYTLWMLDGLAYLHSRGVVHRDIKPDNILLDSNGVIKYVDFGAAKVLAKSQGTIQRTRARFPAMTPANAGPGLGGAGAFGQQGLGPGQGAGAGAMAAAQPGGLSLQGTPMYMSPEVINPGGVDGADGEGGPGSGGGGGGGKRRTGRHGAMDIWSLGCVVLECATGRRPWAQLDNEWAIMFHIGNLKQAPALPDPDQLSALGIDFIRACLTIDPEERPTANELREHPWIVESIEMLNAANAEEVSSQTTSQTRTPST